jgi:hypothetical protein
MTHSMIAKTLALASVTGAIVFAQIPSAAYASTTSRCADLYPTGGGSARVCKTWEPGYTGSLDGTYEVDNMAGAYEVPDSTMNVRVYYNGKYNRTLSMDNLGQVFGYVHVDKLGMKVCNQWYCTGLW